MPVLLAHGVERPHLRTPWVLLAAVTGAVLDLGVAVLFWAAEGVDPLRIPQSIAAWFVGRAAYDGDTSTALFGVLAYTALVWLLAHLYLAAFNRVRETYSTNGLMADDGAATALRVLTRVQPELADVKVDLARTYTNDFVRKARQKHNV